MIQVFLLHPACWQIMKLSLTSFCIWVLCQDLHQCKWCLNLYQALLLFAFLVDWLLMKFCKQLFGCWWHLELQRSFKSYSSETVSYWSLNVDCFQQFWLCWLLGVTHSHSQTRFLGKLHMLEPTNFHRKCFLWLYQHELTDACSFYNSA